MNQRFNPSNVVFLKTKGRHRNILFIFLFVPQMQELEAETHNHVIWTRKAVLMTSDPLNISILQMLDVSMFTPFRLLNQNKSEVNYLKILIRAQFSPILHLEQTFRK